MAKPKNMELQASREAFNALKPLPPYYGVKVADHFPSIDVPKLQQAVAGRVVYDEGLKALQIIVRMYPRRRKAASNAVAA